MWKRIVRLGILASLAPAVAAKEPPTDSPSQTPAHKPFASGPNPNPFADPFFAPPDGRPVMEPHRAGSGAAPPDTLVTAPAPFRPERLWLATDFYFATAQGTILPALATSSPNGTPFGAAGALNQPNTTVLFGGRRELTQFRPGLRATAGLWLTEDYRFGVDGTFLYLGDTSSSFLGTTGPNGPVLAQPVFQGSTGTQVGVPVGRDAPGTLSARARSAVIGGDVNFRYGLTTSELGRLDVLMGYRYMNLRDSVEVESTNAFADLPQSTRTVSDHFRTLNQFHGAQVGLGGTHRLFDRLTLTTKATVAIGVDISDVTIRGQTVSPLGTTDGGLLTGPSNIGNYREHYFSVIPEGTVKFGWDFTDRLRLNAGYSFLYWSRVRRAADQIDPAIQTVNRPAFANDSTDYWIQGWTVGLDLRY